MRFLVVVVALAACGSSSPSQVNTCVTKGASYLVSFSEQSGGTCGPLTSQVVNVPSDGMIQGGSSCSSSEATGCMQRNSGCMTSSMGINCDVTTSVTFASDGTTGAGLYTATCSNSSASCTSTYDVTYARQ